MVVPTDSVATTDRQETKNRSQKHDVFHTTSMTGSSSAALVKSTLLVRFVRVYNGLHVRKAAQDYGGHGWPVRLVSKPGGIPDLLSAAEQARTGRKPNAIDSLCRNATLAMVLGKKGNVSIALDITM